MVGRKINRTRKLKHKRSTKSKRSGHKRSTKNKRSGHKTHKKYKRRIQRGGNYTAYPAQAYGPLLNGNGLNQIGSSYNVAAPGGNHYAYNMNVKALPIDSNAPFGKGQQGGKNKKNKQRGGGISSFISGILPDEVMNIGRSFPAAVGHFADKFNGVISTPSSMVYPTQQPLVPNVNATNVLNPVDIQAIYRNANRSVLNL